MEPCTTYVGLYVDRKDDRRDAAAPEELGVRQWVLSMPHRLRYLLA